MSWKKYFNLVTPDGSLSPVSGSNTASSPMSQFGKRNYTSYLPEVYTGHSNRMERYYQYDQMDQDSEVNAALDIIAEFCTQRNKKSDTPFDLKFHSTPTETEAMILKDAMQQFTTLNDFNRRIFRLFRNTLKYGDSFFIRDPETQELIHVHAQKCDKIIVNESKGKEPEQYVFRDLNLNLESLQPHNLLPMSLTVHQAAHHIQIKVTEQTKADNIQAQVHMAQELQVDLKQQ